MLPLLVLVLLWVLRWLTSANVADQVLNALLGEELDEQAGPVWLHSDTSCLHNAVDVVSLQCSQDAGQHHAVRDKHAAANTAAVEPLNSSDVECRPQTS